MDEWDALVAEARPAPLGEHVHEEDLALLYFTSGTTGRPKGVMLTHRNLVANALHKTIACGLQAEDVFLAAAPFFHVAGTAPVLSLIWLGGSLVVLPSFEAAACLDMIERFGVTVAMPVPTMLAALVEEQSRRPRDVSSLRLIGHAGSPITTSLIRRAHEVFPHVELAQYYGATETAAIVTCLGHEERHLDGGRLGSCGQPVVGVAVEVLDAAGRPCAPGDAGEIVVRGPNVTSGYWEDEAATAAAFVDGWYRMGDIGYVDEDRYLWLLDRSTDMIVTGGENVYVDRGRGGAQPPPPRRRVRGVRRARRTLGARRSTRSSSWTARMWRRPPSPTNCASTAEPRSPGSRCPSASSCAPIRSPSRDPARCRSASCATPTTRPRPAERWSCR